MTSPLFIRSVDETLQMLIKNYHKMRGTDQRGQLILYQGSLQMIAIIVRDFQI